jgi:hypothetical protein
MCTGEKRRAESILIAILTGKESLERPRMDGRKILKRILTIRLPN